MLQEITRETLAGIREPVFRDYARMYRDIYDGFLEQVASFGLPFETHGAARRAETAELPEELKRRGDIEARCEDASLVYRRLSSACEVCKRGVGTVTCHLSFRCHRQCFFCFNPNQENFPLRRRDMNDWRCELDEMSRAGARLTHIALTGGEPLLHPEEAVAFFRRAGERFPEAHRRLYTSGDLLTEEQAAQLGEAGLDEIRFSYKLEDAPALQETVLRNMALAKRHIPCVMVEMPVMPDAEEAMRALLLRLEELGVWGINLLELCFPYHNSEAFRARGYALKDPPYRTLYNFWYAGGLPVAGSELIALRLLRFAAEQRLSLGVHYCSLENKNFGQIYHQNSVGWRDYPTLFFSPRDYYLKTVKAFGADALRVRRLLEKRGAARWVYDEEGGFLQLHPADARLLRGRDVELALSVNVLEERESGTVCRELKLLRARAEDCDPDKL